MPKGPWDEAATELKAGVWLDGLHLMKLFLPREQKGRMGRDYATAGHCSVGPQDKRPLNPDETINFGRNL